MRDGGDDGDGGGDGDSGDGGDGAHGNERLCRLHFTSRDLPRIRIEVEECAAGAGLAEPRRGEFVVAVDAVATNAVEHAGGTGRLLLRNLGTELECQVEDSGPGFSEDVIPELAPGVAGATAGRGLWLARLVTDRLSVERRGGDATGPAPAPVPGLGGSGDGGPGDHAPAAGLLPATRPAPLRAETASGAGPAPGPGSRVTLAIRLPGCQGAAATP